MGFRVWGSGFGVQVLGFKVQGPEFGVQSLGFRVWGSGFGFQVFVSGVEGFTGPELSTLNPVQKKRSGDWGRKQRWPPTIR